MLADLVLPCLAESSHLTLNQWTLVLFLAPDVVIDHTEADDGAGNKHAIIHVLRRRRPKGRPETPEDDEDDVEAGESVVDGAPYSGDAPGAPDETRLDNVRTGVGFVGGGGASSVGADIGWVIGVGRGAVEDLAGGAAPEEECTRDEVGSVQAGYGKGDDIFKNG